MQKRTVVLIGLFMLPVWCVARSERPDSVFQAGPGLLISDKPHKGGDTRILPIPAVYYQQGSFSIFGPRAAWGFYEADGLSIAGLATIRLEGYKSSESRHLRDMGRRRDTVEAGLSIVQDLSWARISAEWTSDILNEHSGHEIRLNLLWRFTDILDIDNLELTPSIGGNWRSKQLNNYYYGVKQTEAIENRPAYNAGSSIGLLTAVSLDYALSERWTLFGMVSTEWLGSEITDSPIVGQHYRMSTLLGAVYRF